ncbi:MAG: fused MFS/spermidine synthase [Planctomycetes bacterium]|nr:fused MFS/spermidine synthase [Planctomycetota bacterium]
MALPLYIITLILSSSLLFFVQPMVGKMILPLLGGTPAVWNTCMVFFQACLLAGYAYAHGSGAWLGARKQAWLHLTLLAVPLLVLPIGFGADVSPPASGNPVLWLLVQLTLCAGLPFFVVSASAPLLQKWFAQTGHPSAKDPYFLYAASNVGSLGALLGYPLLVEPNMALGAQTTAWSVGYGLLVVAFICCAIALWRSKSSIATPDAALDSSPRVSMGWPRRLHWIILAAVPSSLMLGVTTHVTTNVAAVPLLWVVPLAIYLLTFIMVFAARPPISHRAMVQSFPFVVVVLGLLFFAPPQELGWYVIPIHLGAFFVAAMVCHGELARCRPGTQHLTEYYLWMSFGGVLGGLFNAIVAPLTFNSIAEYPLAVVAACMLMPRTSATPPSRLKSQDSRLRSQVSRLRSQVSLLDFAMPLGVGLIALAIVTGLKMSAVPLTWLSLMAVFFIPAFLSFQFKESPIRFGLAIGVVLLVTAFYAESGSGDVLAIERNFFGVKKVMFSPDGRTRLLAHGTTNHGSQAVDAAMQDEPLAYFHRRGPLGDVFKTIADEGSRRPVGIIGLGVGSIAAYASPNQQFTYYEIDPAVEVMARNETFFTFLSKCRGTVDVVLGDGRLTIARAPDKHFGLIILDAFSSDAIPTHLLSLEAMNVYLSKLADDGLLAFHISNGFLNLEPVVARLADQAHLACISRSDRGVRRDELADGQLAAHYVVMSRIPERLAALESKPRWHRCETSKDVPVWTDQYCDILGVLRLPQPGTEPAHMAQRPPPREPSREDDSGELKVR